MMDDYKKDYSDFFNRPNSENREAERSGREEPSGQPAGDQTSEARQEQPSYYYSYGPYKSMDHAAGDSPSASQEKVEVTPPRSANPFMAGNHYSQQPPYRAWEYGGKRRGTSFRTIFTAFMAGVIVVAGLMFASDRMNLFTADSGVLSSAGSPDAVTASAADSGDAGLKNAALSIDRPDNIAAIAKAASPAVVKIDTFVDPKSRSNSGSMFNDPTFQQFFGDFFGQQEPQQQQQQSNEPQPLGMGSGFFFDKSGYILTNEHVVDGADPNNIQVTVQGYEKPFTAQLLGTSYDLDLAVLKISGSKDFPYLKLGDSNQLDVGDWLIAIGNPYGFDHTVTVGVLSATERPITIPDQSGTRNYKHLLQTDASINPGNSGGPLLDLDGDVIGINTAISAQAQGIGFAIPTSTISTVLDNLKNNVKIPHPYVGVYMTDNSDALAKQFNLGTSDGVIISTVVQDSPADKAGIQPYDVILDMDGQKIKDATDFQNKVAAAKVGQKVTLTIMRNGQTLSTGLTIGDDGK